ncbi:MAG: hypothetical protein D6723_09130 [Acidobacteria bacterium]|nr:MAG: hypothetical protein D6723_09130 [Acidobacteriota bacterium]
MDVLLTALNASISAIFAAVALRQYLRRRKIFQLVWWIALMTFAISASCEFILTMRGYWTAPLYITWYLTGAMLGAVYFGQGTAYYLLPRRWAHASMVVVVLLSLYGVYLTFTVPLDLSAVAPAVPSGDGFPRVSQAGIKTPRWLTPFLNIYGFLWLNGGALYSAIQLARRRMERHRVLANILIAAGGTTVGVTSAMNRLGYHQFQYIGEVIGISLMFWGFMMSTRGALALAETPRRAAEASPPR